METSKKEPLFDLIKSLSKSEKRYFQTHSKNELRDGKSNSLTLFNAIIKFDSYNEELIRKTTSNDIDKKDFTFTKSYLYKTLLKSLNAFHREKNSIDTTLNEICLSAEILYNRTLYTQALKLCKKGINSAEAHERFEHLLTLKKWEYKLLEKLNKKDIDNYSSSAKKTIEKATNNLEYRTLSNQVYDYIIRSGASREEKEIKALDTLITSSLKKIDSQPMCSESKILFHGIKGMFYYFSLQHKKSVEHWKQSLNILLENTEYASSNPEIYITTYNNLVVNNILSSNHIKAKETLRNFENYIHTLKDSNLKTTTYSYIFSIKTPYYTDTGQFKEGYEELKSSLETYAKYEKKFSTFTNTHIQYYMAYLCFGNKHYKETIGWLNKVLDTSETVERENTFVFARILSLICHYELGNFDLLEYQLKNTKNYLSNKSKSYKAEELSIKLINDLIRKPENSTEIFQSYALHFETTLNQDDTADQYFKFSAWIEEKLTGESYEEVIKKSL